MCYFKVEAAETNAAEASKSSTVHVVPEEIESHAACADVDREAEANVSGSAKVHVVAESRET